VITPTKGGLSNDEIFVQKMDYIHNNPVNAGLCQFPSDYKYSSAKFYENKEIEFDFLTHYLD
jgi:putative transposase